MSRAGKGGKDREEGGAYDQTELKKLGYRGGGRGTEGTREGGGAVSLRHRAMEGMKRGSV